MDDEHTLREAEARVRAALTPDDAVQHRVVMRALAEERTRPPHIRRVRYAVLGLATALVLFGASTWQWRRATPLVTSSPSLTVIGRGSMVVVESEDGRRWIVGPAPERSTDGSYVIAIRE